MRGYDFYFESRVKSVFNINGIEWMVSVQGYIDHVVQLKATTIPLLIGDIIATTREDPTDTLLLFYFILKEGNKLVKPNATDSEKLKNI
ncbi:MAG: hypothetical protein IPH42_07210 [Bacteroidetes bacterium]|nr:hypothetical protein [Bacteroidota bacterium]